MTAASEDPNQEPEDRNQAQEGLSQEQQDLNPEQQDLNLALEGLPIAALAPTAAQAATVQDPAVISALATAAQGPAA